MKIKYCLPIIENSKEEVLESIQKYRNEYQYLEIWLDPIKDFDNAFVDRLIYMLQNQLILLFHRGDKIKKKLSPEKKKEILDLLENEKAFIDLDLSETEELDYLQKQNKIRKIISYHNYKETPVDLAEIIKRMDSFNPTIYKIATRCKNETDALKLLLIQQNLKQQEKKHIVLGMEEIGSITRIFGTLWGNEMIYAPQTKKKISAPGQLTKKQLETIFNTLKQ